MLPVKCEEIWLFDIRSLILNESRNSELELCGLQSGYVIIVIIFESKKRWGCFEHLNSTRHLS
jgi:hypothetical protein